MGADEAMDADMLRGEILVHVCRTCLLHALYTRHPYSSSTSSLALLLLPSTGNTARGASLSCDTTQVGLQDD